MKRYNNDGLRVTDCCGALSSYHEDEMHEIVLCCNACFLVVDDGEGDGTERLPGHVPSPEKDLGRWIGVKVAVETKHYGTKHGIVQAVDEDGDLIIARTDNHPDRIIASICDVTAVH